MCQSQTRRRSLIDFAEDRRLERVQASLAVKESWITESECGARLGHLDQKLPAWGGQPCRPMWARLKARGQLSNDVDLGELRDIDFRND